MKFKVYDEDGLFSIVDTHQYKTFVNEDWTLEQLFEHFVNEMNKNHMIIWQADENGGGNWNIEVLNEPTDKPCFRSFYKTIEVTNRELYLINYTDLTMAAQFDDVVLPVKRNADWKITLENGIYTVTIKQMINPDDYEETDETTFEIILYRGANADSSKAEKVFWWQE